MIALDRDQYVEQLEKRCQKLEFTLSALIEFTKSKHDYNRAEFMNYLAKKIQIEGIPE